MAFNELMAMSSENRMFNVAAAVEWMQKVCHHRRNVQMIEEKKTKISKRLKHLFIYCKRRVLLFFLLHLLLHIFCGRDQNEIRKCLRWWRQPWGPAYRFTQLFTIRNRNAKVDGEYEQFSRVCGACDDVFGSCVFPHFGLFACFKRRSCRQTRRTNKRPSRKENRRHKRMAKPTNLSNGLV